MKKWFLARLASVPFGCWVAAYAVAVVAFVLSVAAVKTANANPPAVVSPAAAAVVPVYTAVYSPDQVGGTDLAAAVRELAAEVKALREEVSRLKAAPAAAPVKAVAEKPDPLAVAKAACAKCHTPAAAEESGGGFVLFAADGKFAQLDVAAMARGLRRVSNGSMPPKPAPALGAGDKAALAEWFRK